MITRAQAEALLTLAESLEACERVGVTIEVLPHGEAIVRHPAGGFTLSNGHRFGKIEPTYLRFMIQEETPKRSGRQPDPPNYQEFPKTE